MSDEVTFRDFAGAIMGGDDAAAAQVLETLLALDGAGARAATAHFRAQMSSDPQFMMKAMGLRQVVQGGDPAQLGELLGDVFGLEGAAREDAAEAIRARYG